MNYATLKTNIGEWLNRQDLEAVIPTFIELAEAEFNRRIRVREMLKRADATIETQYTALPGDFVAMKSLYLVTNPTQVLEQKSIEGLQDTKRYHYAAKPKHFAVTGGTFEVYPAPDTSYTAEMVYYSSIPVLSDTNTSNWLLAKHPDVYLYGALIQTAPYLRDDARIQIWSSLYEKAMSQMKLLDEQSSYSAGALTARTRSY